MQKKKFTSLKIIVTPIIMALLLFSSLMVPAHAALSAARDLTGTWKNSISEMYYEMDPSDPTTRMNDVTVTYNMQITQSGNQISIVLNINELSSVTDTAYWNEYGMAGVPIVGFNQIGFSGTVSSASFTADEIGASTGTAEHLAGTFTSDIITATLTGNAETTAVNGIIVLRSGSSATLPPTVTAAPTAAPTPAPAPPTPENLARISVAQGETHLAATGMPVTTQSSIGTGSEVQTGADGIVGFNYPDNGGTVYLGANSDAGWVYLQPQTDQIYGNISYTAVPPPATSAFQFSEGIEPDEFGQAGVSLAAEVGVGLVILAATGAPITLGGAVVVEGTLLLGSGIAYMTEQLSPQEGTYDIRPLQVPQGLVIGDGTDYVVTVNSGYTTIQVIDGSVLFVDQYTNNSIALTANQMLTLPSGFTTGFSQQDLQSKVSAFDSSSINQWWTNITPIATSTPNVTATPIVASPTAAAISFLGSPMILAFIIIIVFIAIIGVLIAVRLKKRSPRLSDQPIQNIPYTGRQKSPKATAPTDLPPPPPTSSNQAKPSFCPNCGKQLPIAKSFCPSCGSDLRPK